MCILLLIFITFDGRKGYAFVLVCLFVCMIILKVVYGFGWSWYTLTHLRSQLVLSELLPTGKGPPGDVQKWNFCFLHNSGHAWESAAVNRNMSLRKKLLNRQVRARFQICGYFFTSSLWICDMALVCCQFFSQQQKTYVQSYVAKSDQILHSNPSREGAGF